MRTHVILTDSQTKLDNNWISSHLCIFLYRLYGKTMRQDPESVQLPEPNIYMISQRRIISIRLILPPPQPQLRGIIRPQVQGTPQCRPPSPEQPASIEAHETSLLVNKRRHRPRRHLPRHLTPLTSREHHPRLHNITGRGNPRCHRSRAPRAPTRYQARFQNSLLLSLSLSLSPLS